MNLLSKAWERWKVIGGVLGNYQGRAIVQFFYYTIMLPFGLGVRLLSDPLKIKTENLPLQWVNRDPVSNQLEDARRQF
ncbi:MAG: hypothetical protein M5R40_22230 [Anaerolineae bacterium]|nr:hypothetical protein [Anaerolineae bacterium]